MTNQSKPDQQGGEGLPLEVRIQTTRYALFRLFRANAPYSRLREEWSKLETLLDTEPTRDAAEGVRARTFEVSRLEYEGWSQASVVSGYWIKALPDSAMVGVCNGDLRKLSEATHEIATPKPTSDPMREAVNRLREYGRSWNDSDDTGRKHSLSNDIELVCRAALSAPVSLPDGGMLDEATQAQHVGKPKGEPAKFVRNGKLETCKCFDCRALSEEKIQMTAADNELEMSAELIAEGSRVPFDRCRAEVLQRADKVLALIKIYLPANPNYGDVGRMKGLNKVLAEAEEIIYGSINKCPHCHTDLSDGPIPVHLHEYYAPPYLWSRKIAITNVNPALWQCPDCKGTWLA